MSISFFASGIPKGQPRPRAFARNFNGKWQARVFDAGTAEGWKSQIAIAAKPHLPSTPIAGPVSIFILLEMPRPKGHSGKKGLKPNAPHWHTGKPDLDNHAKAILDALTQVGLWGDDAQVASLSITKRYAEFPGARITVEELNTPTTQQPKEI